MTGYAATFSKQADNGITCTITSVVYANYVDNTVLLSAVTMIQYLKVRNFAEEHHSLRDKNSQLNSGTVVFRLLRYSRGRAIIKHSPRIYEFSKTALTEQTTSASTAGYAWISQCTNAQNTRERRSYTGTNFLHYKSFLNLLE